jgi:flagellar protein FlaJ
MISSYKKTATMLFGKIAEKYIDSFRPIEPHLRNANIKILLKTWICIILLSTVLSFFISFFVIFIILTFFVQIDIFFHIFLIMFLPIFISSLVFLFFYAYPMEIERRKKSSIELNLPFAITHMAAISSSGIPPEFMFELLTGFEEYGEISEQSKIIMRNIKTFGMSSVDAIKDVCKRMPSKEFKEILLGIASTIETGGDLTSYLKEMSEKALFEYKVKREQYLKTLSTYADVYTGVLVAAPLMMISMLATMSIIGGTVMGLTISDMVFLITWIILPVLNMIFITALHLTYPGV